MATGEWVSAWQCGRCFQLILAEDPVCLSCGDERPELSLGVDIPDADRAGVQNVLEAALSRFEPRNYAQVEAMEASQRLLDRLSAPATEIPRESSWLKTITPRTHLPELWTVITKDQHGKLYGPNEIWICGDQTPWWPPSGSQCEWQPLSEYFYDNDLVEALPLPLPKRWRELFPDTEVALVENAAPGVL